MAQRRGFRLYLASLLAPRDLLADPVTAPHGGGVLVVDDSGDREDGTATAFTGRQWLAPFVVALRPRRGTWAYGDAARTPVDAARALAWGGPGATPGTGSR